MFSKHLQLPNSTYLFVMARQPGAKNKTRIELTLSPWYGEKLKELRVDSGFESEQAFAAWLLRNTVQILCGQREPTNQKLGLTQNQNRREAL